MYRDAKAQQTFPSTNAPLKQQLGILSYWHVILGLFSILVGVAGPMAMHRLQLAASDSKPYLTFTEFYPFYLSEHSNQTCKRLHIVGTSLAVLFVAFDRTLLVSMGIATGFGLFHLCISLPHGFVDFSAMILSFLLSQRLIKGSSLSALVLLVIAYGFAWAGHFFFELNRPATFTYPSFSLAGDLRMWFEVVTLSRPF